MNGEGMNDTLTTDKSEFKSSNGFYEGWTDGLNEGFGS